MKEFLFRPQVILCVLGAMLLVLVLEAALEPPRLSIVAAAATREEALALKPRLAGPGEFQLGLYRDHWSMGARLIAHDSRSIWINVPGLLGEWIYTRTEFTQGSSKNISSSRYRLYPWTLPLLAILVIAWVFARHRIKRETARA